MKNGQTPIHIQRWAPNDYQNDEHVKLLLVRRDYVTLTFYRQFLDHSFLQGGDLPADPETLAAILDMPKRDVVRALAFCVGRIVFQDGERLYQPRIRRDVAAELELRESQRRRANRRWHPEPDATAMPPHSHRIVSPQSPPSPSPSPSPTPTPLPPIVPPPGGRIGNGRQTWLTPACEAWSRAYKVKPPERIVKQMAREFGPLREQGISPDQIGARLAAYLDRTEAAFVNLAKFAATFGEWEPPQSIVRWGKEGQ